MNDDNKKDKKSKKDELETKSIIVEDESYEHDEDSECCDHDHNEQDEDELEYEFELIMDTAARLGDLSMALTHYNDELAKQALGVALGTLCGEYHDEEPCLHKVSELAELQMNHVLEHIAQHEKDAEEQANKPLN